MSKYSVILSVYNYNVFNVEKKNIKKAIQNSNLDTALTLLEKSYVIKESGRENDFILFKSQYNNLKKKIVLDLIRDDTELNKYTNRLLQFVDDIFELPSSFTSEKDINVRKTKNARTIESDTAQTVENEAIKKIRKRINTALTINRNKYNSLSEHIKEIDKKSGANEIEFRKYHAKKKPVVIKNYQESAINLESIGYVPIFSFVKYVIVYYVLLMIIDSNIFFNLIVSKLFYYFPLALSLLSILIIWLINFISSYSDRGIRKLISSYNKENYNKCIKLADSMFDQESDIGKISLLYYYRSLSYYMLQQNDYASLDANRFVALINDQQLVVGLERLGNVFYVLGYVAERSSKDAAILYHKGAIYANKHFYSFIEIVHMYIQDRNFLEATKFIEWGTEIFKSPNQWEKLQELREKIPNS